MSVFCCPSEITVGGVALGGRAIVLSSSNLYQYWTAVLPLNEEGSLDENNYQDLSGNEIGRAHV